MLPDTGDLTLLRTTRSEPEVLEAFGRCAFHGVFNNRDDHTKSFSFVLNARVPGTGRRAMT